MQEVNRFEIQKFPERPDAGLMKANGTPPGVVDQPRTPRGADSSTHLKSGWSGNAVGRNRTFWRA